MAPTDPWLQQKIRHYYETTTERGYLAHWSGDALSLHLGLATDATASRDEAMRNANAYLADRARVKAGSWVLDAGCGVGGSSLWLARERGARVTGVTLVERQVELARSFALQQGLSERVHFVCADYAATPFEPDSFDVVWNLESLSHAQDAQSYLAHAARLLRGGGRFVCMEPFRGERGDPAQRQAMCEGMVLPNLLSVAETTALLAELGFVDIEAVDLREQVERPAAAARAAAQNAAVGLRLEAAMLGPVDPTYEAHVRAAIGMADGITSGSVVYAYVGATKPPR